MLNTARLEVQEVVISQQISSSRFHCKWYMFSWISASLIIVKEYCTGSYIDFRSGFNAQS
jgi:hypothetical protein